MKKELKDLIILYDTPTLAEFVGFKWGQDIIAKYLAWKVGRKLDRYIRRKEREDFIKSYLKANL